MQTRRESLKESAYNIAIGYTVALLSQLIVFPIVGVHVSIGTNLEIGLYFTIISLIRSYLVRRWFNSKEES